MAVSESFLMRNMPRQKLTMGRPQTPYLKDLFTPIPVLTFLDETEVDVYQRLLDLISSWINNGMSVSTLELSVCQLPKILDKVSFAASSIHKHFDLGISVRNFVCEKSVNRCIYRNRHFSDRTGLVISVDYMKSLLVIGEMIQLRQFLVPA